MQIITFIQDIDAKQLFLFKLLKSSLDFFHQESPKVVSG